jgi:hypothetical protein
MGPKKIFSNRDSMNLAKKPAASSGAIQSASKKPAVKSVSRKPAASDLTEKKVADMSKHMNTMSVFDKMDFYAKNQKKFGEGQNVQTFLNTMTEADRQCVWKRFEHGRSKDDECKKNWQKIATGLGSDRRKKELLQAFLTGGRDVKSKHYTSETSRMLISDVTTETSEWVPFSRILREFGLAETRRRLLGGSIEHRKDPCTPEEMQFKHCTTLETHKEESSHTYQGKAKANAEVNQWLAIKGYTQPEFADPSGGNENILKFLDEAKVGIPAQKKRKVDPTLALKDQDETETEAAGSASASAAPGNPAGLALLADSLSQNPTGQKATCKQVNKRIEDMMSVATAMKGQVQCHCIGKKTNVAVDSIVKILDNNIIALKKLLKKDKITCEQAKGSLVNASKAIAVAGKLCTDFDAM